MKHFILSLACIIGLTLSSYSCSEQQDIATESRNSQSYFTELYKIVSDADMERAANPDNPYDYIGRLHFQGIEYLLSHAEPQFESLSTATDNFIASIYAGTKADTIYVENVLSKEQIDQIIHEAMSLTINTDDIPSPQLQNEFNRLSASIADLFNNPGDFSYERIKSQIVSLESTVISNTSLPEAEKRTVLEATSVFRYSTAQWEAAVPLFQDDNVPSYVKDKKKRKWWQWLVIGLADVLGGVAGGAVGSLVANTGGGVVAGAVLASGATSAAFGADIVISTDNPLL
ncbi:MAG TPA: hypothetical protein IAB96_02800 [Candidatus Coprenecus pullicola]|jgi:hypothetical protein|nr:hypothetical protein [Candidatus Coprenecus pullicola]